MRTLLLGLVTLAVFAGVGSVGAFSGEQVPAVHLNA